VEKNSRGISAAEFHEHCRGFDVDLARQRRVGLTLRTFAQRRAVDDGVRFLRMKCGSDGGKVEQVESGSRQTDGFKLRREPGRKLDEVIADQSARTGDPNRSAWYFRNHFYSNTASILIQSSVVGERRGSVSPSDFMYSCDILSSKSSLMTRYRPVA
jgi:hypothetical protein